jgi:hypothetical protein
MADQHIERFLPAAFDGHRRHNEGFHAHPRTRVPRLAPGLSPAVSPDCRRSRQLWHMLADMLVRLQRFAACLEHAPAPRDIDGILAAPCATRGAAMCRLDLLRHPHPTWTLSKSRVFKHVSGAAETLSQQVLGECCTDRSWNRCRALQQALTGPKQR